MDIRCHEMLCHGYDIRPMPWLLLNVTKHAYILVKKTTKTKTKKKKYFFLNESFLIKIFLENFKTL